MVVLHTGLLAGCLLEVWLADRPFLPGARLADAGARARRAGVALVVHPHARAPVEHPHRRRPRACRGSTGGPYRWFPHPNYVAVVVEGIALPLVHTAWITAVVFTVLNAVLLTVRIRAENDALTAARSRA